MIKCSKCHELIGDNVKICPFCSNEISEADRNKAIAENMSFFQEALNNSINEHHKRTKWGIISTLVMILSLCLISALPLESGVAIFLLFATMFAYVIIFFKMRVGRCPYCEDYMRCRSIYMEYCPRCGGRLR